MSHPRQCAVVTFENLTDIFETCIADFDDADKASTWPNLTTTTDDAGDASLDFGQVLNQQTSVDGLVVNTLLAVLLDDVEEIISSSFSIEPCTLREPDTAPCRSAPVKH